MRTAEQTEARLAELQKMKTDFVAELVATRGHLKKVKRNLHAINGAINEVALSLESEEPKDVV